MSDAATALLTQLGALPDSDALPLTEAALAFAAFDRPGIDLKPYRAHLATLAAAVAEALPAVESLDGRAYALRTVLAGKYEYRGDAETYDDLANADLTQVIDRRRGLPVTLGILYIHAARAHGWPAWGLGIPGHFMIRLDGAADSVVLDPFAGGTVCDEAQLRALLKRTGVPLSPFHYQPVPDRDILLRLQNNIKSRLLDAGDAEGAAGVLGRMLLLAPRNGALWAEFGEAQAGLGRLAAATDAYDRAMKHAADDAALRRAATQRQQVRRRLN